MTVRTLLFITLIAGVIPGTAPLAHAQESTFADCKTYAVRRLSQELAPDNPNRIIFSGGPNQPVVITCDETMLSADRIEYDRDSQTLIAAGQVLFQQNDVRIVASRAEMNGKTKLGTFYEASGQAQLGLQPSQKSLFGNLEPDVYFEGRVLTKTGPKSFTLTDGTLTTCVQATPRWEMQMSKGTIVLEKRAILRNMVLKVKNVPLMYVPFMYYPINKEGRSTGFLMPSYSTDAVAGSGIDNAFFLVMGRSADTTFTHKWSSKSGHTLGSEFRYVASPGSRGTGRFVMQNQRELFDSTGTPILPARRSYRLNGDANQELPRGFRLVGFADYYTDLQTQQLFQQDIEEYSQRTRSLSAQLSGAIDRYQISALYEQRDTFFGQTTGPPTALRYGSAPLGRLTIANRAIGRSKVYFSGNAEGAFLLRQNDVSDPTTDLSLWRFSGGPRISAPIGSLPFLTVRTEAAYNVTRWLESRDPVTGAQVPVALNRQLLTLGARVQGPTVSRVFQTKTEFADRLKHVIEPEFNITWVSPFSNFDRVAGSDYLDQQVGGTTTIEYGLTNELHAKRRAPEGSPATAAGSSRAILSARVSQSYYTNTLAALYDPGQLGASAKKFGDINVNITARPTDAVSASARLIVDSKYRTLSSISAYATLNGKHVQVTPIWARGRFVDPLSGLSRTISHSLTTSTTIKTADNRLGGTYSFTMNALTRDFIDQRIVGSYNTQCCGIIFDYQSRQTYLPSIPTNRTFGISFTLAGLGTFANPFGSFGAR